MERLADYYFILLNLAKKKQNILSENNENVFGAQFKFHWIREQKRKKNWKKNGKTITIKKRMFSTMEPNQWK